MAKPDQAWREHVIRNIKMEAPALATTLPAATEEGVGPIVWRGDRSPDPVALLDGAPLARFTAIRQRALDLHGSIPSFDDVNQVRLEARG
jgi:hypothetical protein